MINNPRRMWTSVIFACLIAPFVAMLVLSFVTPRPKIASGGALAAAGGGGGTSAAAPAAGPAGAVEHGSEAMLLAAGDSHVVWVVRPTVDENKTPGFELYERSANTGIWHAASNGTVNFFPKVGTPRGLALSRPLGGGAGSEPVVFGDEGKAYELAINAPDMPLKRLPQEDLVRAVAGGEDQLFALTFGPVQPLHVGDAVPDQQPAAATAPLATPATASTSAATATSPAVAASRVPTAPPPEIFNVYWYPPVSRPAATGTAPVEDVRRPEPGTWSFLPPLGRASADPSQIPSPSSMVTLVESHGRLLAIWGDPTKPRALFVKSLNYAAQDPQWSDTVATTLPENDQMPALSRLFAVTLDQTVYVLWTVPTGGTLSLHGGWLNTDPAGVPESRYKINHLLLPMSLDAAGQGAKLDEVAVGASENSFVVVLGRESGLSSMVFDSRGVRIAEAAPLVPQAPRRDVQIGQQIAMVLIVLLMTLSLWQWRQKAPPMVLPKSYILAPVHMRALAFLIDVVVPYLIVLFLLNTSDGGALGMLSNWLSLPNHPEDLLHQWDLYAFLGLYLVHVTVGEMFFRKSVGKALLGMEVRMLDGKPPTVAAVLVRNLLRVPECAVGIALLYIVVSDRRQRLGDLMAKTVVVSQESPETPEDPDKK